MRQKITRLGVTSEEMLSLSHSNRGSSPKIVSLALLSHYDPDIVESDPTHMGFAQALLPLCRQFDSDLDPGRLDLPDLGFAPGL